MNLHRIPCLAYRLLLVVTDAIGDWHPALSAERYRYTLDTIGSRHDERTP